MRPMRQVAVAAVRCLLPSRLRQTIRVYRRLAETAEVPELMEVPPGRQILVLAPHMDDEVIGCGGTLAKHAIRGCNIVVVVLTDGSLGDPVLESTSTSEPVRLEARGILKEIRKKESRAAAKCLGVQEVQFLDFPDCSLANTQGAREAVARIVADYRPDVLYVPFVTDRHPDHRALADIVASLAVNWPELLVAGYEVWSPLHANCMVDITAQLDRKLKALNCFSSQLQHNYYHHTVLGLNAFRSMYHLQGQGYAEAFFAVPARLFAVIANAVRR